MYGHSETAIVQTEAMGLVEIFHIREWADAIHARRKGREIASRIGFGLVDQTIIAYTISELALKLIQFPEKGHMVIRKMERCKGEAGGGPGLEVRIYDHYRGRERISAEWVRPLVDDMVAAWDPARGNVIQFRKWLAPWRVDFPVYAAGEEQG
ncbi:hypothetical protein ACFSWD_30395 [Paenibacillus xanthanilyticus]